MNQPLIDNAILATAFITAILMVKYGHERKMHAIRAFLLLFSPLVIFYNMWGHTVAVTSVYYQRYVLGTFDPGFHFYSVAMLGIVFIIISGMNIHVAKKIIQGNEYVRFKIHILNAITAFYFSWFIVVNPISLLPVLCSLVSSGVLFFDTLKNRQGNDIVLQKVK